MVCGVGKKRVHEMRVPGRSTAVGLRPDIQIKTGNRFTFFFLVLLLFFYLRQLYYQYKTKLTAVLRCRRAS